MHVLVACNNEDYPSKMKELECSQLYSKCKSMGTISDAQGKLTPQFEVESDRNSNSSKLLWLMSSFPERMKKVRLKMKALEWSQHCNSLGQITPELVLRSGGNLNSFKLSCMSS